MSYNQNVLPPDSQLAVEQQFDKTETDEVYFALQHPSAIGSNGDNLYRIAVQRNGLWELDLKGVRWPDSDKQLVVGVHSSGPITGVRLYHIPAGGTEKGGFRRPTLFNAKPGADILHSPEVDMMPAGHQSVWQDIAIQNPGFEADRPTDTIPSQGVTITGWDKQGGRNLYLQDFSYDGHRNATGRDNVLNLSDDVTLGQTLTEKFDSDCDYQLSIDICQTSTEKLANPPQFKARLLAGQEILGETSVMSVGDGLRTTSVDWKTLKINVSGLEHAKLNGQALRIELSEGDQTDSVYTPYGFYADNVHLQKLSAAMATFAAPEEAGGARSLPASTGVEHIPVLVAAVS